MRANLNRFLLLCGWVGGLACGSAGGKDVTLTRSSWDTTLTVTITESQTPVFCPSVSFKMYLEPEGQEGDDLRVTVVGGPAQVFTGRLTRTDGAYRLAEPIGVGTTECNVESLGITQLSLRASDTNGDQIADAISGTGVGAGGVTSGDVVYVFSFSFTMAGTPT